MTPRCRLSPISVKEAPVDEMSLVQAMSTQRSVREFTEKAVPDEVVRRVIELATKAPNGSNRQAWRFIVIRDPKVRADLTEIYQRCLLDLHGCATLEEALARPGISSMAKGGLVMAKTLAKAPPVLVVVCFHPETRNEPGPSVYPATQNLMLAAWSMGLGTLLVTGLRRREAEIRQLLAIPPDVLISAFIPMGYPARRYSLPKRKPVSEVTYFDGWGKPAKGW